MCLLEGREEKKEKIVLKKGQDIRKGRVGI
jgi:hypothetical protein